MKPAPAPHPRRPPQHRPRAQHQRRLAPLRRSRTRPHRRPPASPSKPPAPASTTKARTSSAPSSKESAPPRSSLPGGRQLTAAEIADTNTIDLVAQNADGTKLLVMIEDRPWGADPDQSAPPAGEDPQLRRPLIVDGSLARHYPETEGQPARNPFRLHEPARRAHRPHQRPRPPPSSPSTASASRSRSTQRTDLDPGREGASRAPQPLLSAASSRALYSIIART